MNIAYRGSFLHEGLKEGGHNVIDISGGDSRNINDRIKAINSPVDLVVIEPYSNSIPMDGLAECEYPIAAYCIDTPLNEFWLKDACKLFDYVFVDQKSTKDNFYEIGLQCSWLPLCAQKSYFMDQKQEYAHDITFIGLIDKYRIKRDNILNLLKKYFNINIVSGVSLIQAQQIFSRSKITLNENLFPGLTLRIFQGLAAGSLIFTEYNSIADMDYFQDKKQLIGYNQNDLIDKMRSVLQSYEKFRHIAEAGQDVCGQGHTSLVRAQALINHISDKKFSHRCSSIQNRTWHELKARYLSVLKYGGMLNNIINDFKAVSHSGNQFAAEALMELGNIRK